MAKYIITGGKKLRGKITLSGNKNGILPCLAACLLTEEEVTLRNVPNIIDVETSLQIFQQLGAKVHRQGNQVKVNCKEISKSNLPLDLANKLRASVLFVGPLLARFGKVEFPHPGGCVIGRRSIDTHLDGFKQLGFRFNVSDTGYKGVYKNSVEDRKIFLDEASVTATENLLLAAALIPTTTTLANCASEPHVQDLCQMLISMGAEVEGVGGPTLKITGCKNLQGTDFTIGTDNVEFGTYAVAAAITGGNLEIIGERLDTFEPVMRPLQRMGIKFKINNASSITVSSDKITAVPKIVANIWPGFPADMMSVAIVLATQAKGVTLCHDWMYESRMFFVDKLIMMGANITIADPHRVLVYGPAKLRGKNLDSPDLRAGMALVLAALIASGTSVINRSEFIERGYEDVVGKLTSLGASIQKIAE